MWISILMSPQNNGTEVQGKSTSMYKVNVRSKIKFMHPDAVTSVKVHQIVWKRNELEYAFVCACCISDSWRQLLSSCE